MKATYEHFHLLLLVLGMLFTMFSSTSLQCDLLRCPKLHKVQYPIALSLLQYHLLFIAVITIRCFLIYVHILVYWLSPLWDVSSMKAGTFLFFSPLYSQLQDLSGMRYELKYEQDKILRNSGFMLVELREILALLIKMCFSYYKL